MKTSSSIDKLIKRQVKLTILSVIAVVLITSTITYALYQTNHENTTDQVISIGNLGLTQTGTPITLEGLYPMEEYDLTSSYPRYEFTLENKTSGVNNDYTLMYELVLRADENSTLTQDDYQYIMYKIDGSEAKPLSESWDSEINGFKILDGRLLSHEETTLATSLANKDKENHSIVFWLSTYAPNSVQGKVLTLKMSLEAHADRFNYLVLQKYTGNSLDANRTLNNIFGKELAPSLFESIATLNKIEIPSNAIDSWDVSNKQNKSIMAWYTDNDNNGLYELYIGQFGGVIANPDCSALFHNFINVTSFDLQYLNTSLVTNMNSMFKNVKQLQTINLSSFDTSKVTNMSDLFRDCTNLVNILGLENFNTSNVTIMHYMFGNCVKLLSLNINKWDTSNVVNMETVFISCRNLNSLNISNWNTTKVNTVYYMFDSLYNIKDLNISNMTFDNVTNYGNMFDSFNSKATIITNECAEEFVRARLTEVNRSNVTLEIVPCVKICYVENIPISTTQSLSSEYTELEYIESTGTQYIDTGYIPKTTTKLELDLSFSGNFKNYNTYGGNAAFLGVTENNRQSVYYINFGGESSEYNTLYPWFNKGYQIDGQDKEKFTITDNIRTNRNTLTVESGRVTYGTVSRAITPKSSDQINSMLIFGQKHVTNGTLKPFTAYNMKVYKMKMYENGTLVRNYVPALRKSDNTIGLYENEEDKFYTNSGTGVFNSDSVQILTGNTIQLAHTIYARPGYTFVGWSTKPDGSGTTFNQGEVVDASVLKSLGDGTITLYAMWEAN